MPEARPSRWTRADLLHAARTAAIFGDIGRQASVAEAERRIADPAFTERDAQALIRFARSDAMPHREDAWNGGPVPLAYLRLPVPAEDVPAGMFGVELDGDGPRLYRVEQPGAPRCRRPWPLVRRQTLGALAQPDAEAVVAAVVADPARAAWLYSDLTRRCSMCGAVLSDPVSRLVSVGPDCRGFPATATLTRAATHATDEPAGRDAYRALAAGFGYRPDRRAADAGAIAAAALLSAWLDAGFPPADLPAIASQAATSAGTPDPRFAQAVAAASLETARLLLRGRSRIAGAVLEPLLDHPDRKVQRLAMETMMDALR